MIRAKKIDPQPWMIAPETTAIMQVLGGLTSPPKALFVGGCVRNSLMGRPVTDIDIATIHRPDDVMTMLTKAGIRAIPTGLAHGTVTAIIDDAKFEITTLRRDVATDGRHAVIAFTDQWEEDAQRRDFTLNTLLASPQGDIFDPIGQGLADLDAGKIVFVGEASQRIAEDYLRILRFFRFHGQYGTGEPDQAALSACRQHAEKVRELSRERVTQEFLKIIALPHVNSVLQLMFDQGVMKSLQDKGYKAQAMEHLCALQSRYEAIEIVPRLCLITGFDMRRIEEWMVLSNAQKQQVDSLNKAFAGLRPISKKKIRELVYHHGNHVVLQAYLIKMARAMDFPDLDIIDIARYWQAPVFPIRGEDLKTAGMMPGRDMGKKLAALELKWIKSDFRKLPKING